MKHVNHFQEETKKTKHIKNLTTRNDRNGTTYFKTTNL